MGKESKESLEGYLLPEVGGLYCFYNDSRPPFMVVGVKKVFLKEEDRRGDASHLLLKTLSGEKVITWSEPIGVLDWHMYTRRVG
jgi:hypothetical protein